MKNEYLEIVNSLNDRKAHNFINKTNGDARVVLESKQLVADYSWIDTIEKIIPYIDAIVRNPKKYIVQEEELMPVEKTKKITQDTIKHLAKHTSLIQDIDEDGSVKPLKLLNVFKEETIDLYENRFIYSLIVNVKIFLNNQLENGDFSLSSKYVKTVNYIGHTYLSNENVKYNLEIKTEYHGLEDEQIKAKATLDRVHRMVDIFNEFLHLPSIRELEGTLPVRSPIRKTNVILKDKNFKKALELWEYVEKYDAKDSTKLVESIKEEESFDLIEKMKIGSYIQYYASENLTKKEVNLNKDFSMNQLKRLVELFVNEDDLNEKDFKNLLNNEFKEARAKKEEIYMNIYDKFNIHLHNHEEKIKNSLLFIK